MGDVRGQVFALSVLARIAGGREDGLRETIEALGGARNSPLARIPGTHFARWVLLPDLTQDVEPGAPGRDEVRWLLFSSTFDGELEPWLEALREQMAPEADAIWSCCDGYPGCADHDKFVRWMLRHKLRTSAFAGAYPDATLDEVREAVRRRNLLRELAMRAGRMSDEELRSDFLAAFRGGG